MDAAPDVVAKRKFPFGLFAWLAGVVAALAAIAWATGAGLLSWEAMVETRVAAQQFVDQNVALAYAGYVALFAVLAVILFPAQLWIIVFGAMLFGFWPALIVSWLASILGAVAVFVLARGALGGFYLARAGKQLVRIEEGFRRDQLSWMLTMRFIPVVPYCVSNVAPAFLGARLPPFLAATMIGVVPYTTAYTFVGTKTASMFDSTQPPDVGSVAADMAPVMLAIAALPMAALALRYLRRRKAAS
jgi:uncharacterized membrane protein YdjX (TVP38/TMEM64 family)